MKRTLILALIPLTVMMLIFSGVVSAFDDNPDEFEMNDAATRTLTRLSCYADWIDMGDPQHPYDRGMVKDMPNSCYYFNDDGLTIVCGNVSNLAPLSVCTGLDTLMLIDCELSDLSPLSDLPNLNEVYIHNCTISDLSSLGVNTGLQDLYINRSMIDDPSQLSALTSLDELFIDGCNISDLSPVSTLTQLNKLYLSDNSISDISLLSGLTGLTELGLSGNQISDISSLSSFNSLSQLKLDDNEIVDIAPLLAIDMHPYDSIEGSDSTCPPCIYISDNLLSTESINDYIPRLEEKGIKVSYKPVRSIK